MTIYFFHFERVNREKITIKKKLTTTVPTNNTKVINVHTNTRTHANSKENPNALI